MSNKNGTQTISNENQVAVVGHNASPLRSDSKPGKQSKIRRKRLLVISAVIVLVIAGGHFAWNAFQYEDTDDAQVDGHVMPLSPRVNGHIKAVYVNEGQLVHAGEAMMTIDAEDYKIAEELAQVNLSEALSAAASSQHNANVQIANAEVARRELQVAQAELNLSYTVTCSPVTGIVGKRLQRRRIVKARVVGRTQGEAAMSTRCALSLLNLSRRDSCTSVESSSAGDWPGSNVMCVSSAHLPAEATLETVYRPVSNGPGYCRDVSSQSAAPYRVPVPCPRPHPWS
jgi:multidrug efflux pump subunit AcrA (membrane-fusion protein)